MKTFKKKKPTEITVDKTPINIQNALADALANLYTDRVKVPNYRTTTAVEPDLLRAEYTPQTDEEVYVDWAKYHSELQEPVDPLLTSTDYTKEFERRFVKTDFTIEDAQEMCNLCAYAMEVIAGLYIEVGDSEDLSDEPFKKAERYKNISRKVTRVTKYIHSPLFLRGTEEFKQFLRKEGLYYDY